MDEAKKAELESKYGDVAVVETEFGSVAFKRLDRRQRNQYLKMISDHRVGEAADWVCLATVVEPKRETFDEWIDKRVGLPMKCIPAINKLNALASEDEGND